ncbi:MlaD family protein [Hymenobacter ginsengisoli]|uniref:MlaD family protein n=1 Tax=Hymenobacter ginsengisoli TaxID=1051626 RepID=A0ABP8Q8F5_9BACT|nr:MlaD family protein [Hymenobacter sp. KCTC 23674]MBO2033640.1 MCE family protein [Hymenobacter sp. BT559]
MSKEIKVGLLAVVALVALAIGFNFLRGSNLLSSDRTYYAIYPNVDGLNVGAPVILNGIKVGQVKNLELQPKDNNSIKASLELQKGVTLGDSTKAGLSGSLLGSKTITLMLGRNTKEYSGGETLRTTTAIGIADAFQAKALPVLDTVGATLAHINGFLNKDAQTNIQGTLLGARASTEALQRLIASNQANINEITRNLAHMSAALNKSTAKLDRIANNFTQLSDSLKSAPVGPALRNLNTTLVEAQTSLKGVSTALNDKKGSLGKLINDTLLYNNLNATAASSNALIQDLQANPKRYVHFSVFGGGKDKTKKETTKSPDGSVTTETKKVTTAPALTH